MNRNSTDFLIPMFPFTHYSDFNILIVNQTTPDNIIISNYITVKIINVFEKGLSKSRNLALDNVDSKLCVIVDDDVEFKEDFEKNILNTFNAEPDAALISFRVETKLGKLYKKYPEHRKIDLKATDRLNIMSIEMVLNKPVIDKYNIRFNEMFGLGAKFEMGEEAIFIDRLYKNKLKIVMEPKVIVTHENDTTHTKIDLSNKYYVQGALFTALYAGNYLLWVFLKILFELKQHKIKINQVHKAIRAAIDGRKDFLNIK
ncbi:glycosyltransferase family 2 protein [Flavobacterium arcticum]|uniref:Glycosyltransferase family 2 protein n=2 Tax=Flavobacterium arcticum TaxID=1784713 RepID=A0A345HEC8_9FLAO|nr:glycosyltransferase family 2 protein [Flavobacterium arcticum]